MPAAARSLNSLGTAGESIFASGLYRPGVLAFDSVGNLFFVDYEILDHIGDAAIYRITPNGILTIFASGLTYPCDVTFDKTGDLFVADYNSGTIYKYKPDGSRKTFASGLDHPVGLTFDSTGSLFVADNSIGNVYQGSIYKYKSDGSRVTFAVLGPTDRPADLAFDRLGNLYMADLGGKIYEYNLSGVLRRQGRITFGSIPNGAESLAFDSAGNLFVVDAGDVNGKGNAIYKFTSLGVRSLFVPEISSGSGLRETFSHVAFRPMACCQ